MEELFPAPDLIDFPLNLHQAMLEDKTRVRAFGRALREVLEPGDVVVDIGTGTGILAFLALESGAGIERSWKFVEPVGQRSIVGSHQGDCMPVTVSEVGHRTVRSARATQNNRIAK